MTIHPFIPNGNAKILCILTKMSLYFRHVAQNVFFFFFSFSLIHFRLTLFSSLSFFSYLFLFEKCVYWIRLLLHTRTHKYTKNKILIESRIFNDTPDFISLIFENDVIECDETMIDFVCAFM